jgi:hypothetical protein
MDVCFHQVQSNMPQTIQQYKIRLGFLHGWKSVDWNGRIAKTRLGGMNVPAWIIFALQKLITRPVCAIHDNYRVIADIIWSTNEKYRKYLAVLKNLLKM